MGLFIWKDGAIYMEGWGHSYGDGASYMEVWGHLIGRMTPFNWKGEAIIWKDGAIYMEMWPVIWKYGAI